MCICLYSSELALPWDPLASAYHLMTAAQRALVCLQCPLNAVSSEVEDRSSTTESFVKDATVNASGMYGMQFGVHIMNNVHIITVENHKHFCCGSGYKET